MPLREDLLQPIAGDNPSGKPLKYDRVYDQIKEARTEEDMTLPSGGWERTAKRADTNLVLKLAGDALANKSKDLQLAVWLGEAYIKREGAAIIQPVLTLLLNLQKEFWPTIYPEIDEEDTGLRAVPLQWAANRYAALVYDLPVTKSGINYHAYKAGRALGYEADAADNEAKTKARSEALKRGNLTAEDVDDGVAGSPKSFYVGLDEHLQSARDVLEDLALYCEEQYGEDGPSYRKLRDSLDEVHNVVQSLLNEKRILEPDVIAAPEPQYEPDPEPDPVEMAPAPTVLRLRLPCRRRQLREHLPLPECRKAGMKQWLAWKHVPPTCTVSGREAPCRISCRPAFAGASSVSMERRLHWRFWSRHRARSALA